MNGIVLKASDTKERVAFLSQFGWEVSEDPLEVAEVIIPTEFDETYKAYNDIQKKQGFDLEKYKGTRVKRWTYEIKNYPGYAGNSGCIRANILVCDGNVPVAVLPLASMIPAPMPTAARIITLAVFEFTESTNINITL